MLIRRCRYAIKLPQHELAAVSRPGSNEKLENSVSKHDHSSSSSKILKMQQLAADSYGHESGLVESLIRVRAINGLCR